ncbi:MAG: glycosyltransferase family 39 protein, partial [Chloroflexota bacterium]
MIVVKDNAQRNQIVALAIVVVFVILAIWVSLIVPVFEAPDESSHYLYADFVARTWQLPTLDYNNAHHEYHQPPLYYWLNAIWLEWAGEPDPSSFLQPNPAAAISDTASFGNKNAYQHDFSTEAWPWRGTVLAMHLGRLTSIVLGAATVWFAYLIGRGIFPTLSSLALITATFVAFNPQFIFISASLNNDNLATLLVTVSIWLALRLNQISALTWRHALVAGGVVGAAILAKPTGWISGLPLGTIFLLAFIQSRSKHHFYNLIIFGLTPLLLSGWWIFRNIYLYQDPLLQRYMMVYLHAEAAPDLSLGQFLLRLQEAEISFWATFGWLNIVLPENFYWLYRFLVRGALLGAGLGLLLSVWRRKLSGWSVVTTIWIPGLILLGMGVTMWQWVSLAGGIQGRLLFPAIVPIMLLIVWGWYQILGERLIWVWPICLLPIAMYAFAFVLKPAYALPHIDETRPLTMTAVDLPVTDTVQLAGYSLPSQPWIPGQPRRLTIYWFTKEPISEAYGVFVHAVDEIGIIIAQTQGFTGRGLLPTDQWPSERYITDEIEIPLPGLVYAPTTGTFFVGLYDPQTDQTVQQPVQIGSFSVLPTNGPYQVNWQIDFEQGISLRGFDLSDRVVKPDDDFEVTLYWQTSQPISENYTAFVHLLDPEGNR